MEQKNGSVVRRLVGYRRLEGSTAAAILARLYAASRLFVNFFQPSFKLKEKLRIGGRTIKRYAPFLGRRNLPKTYRRVARHERFSANCLFLLASPTGFEPVLPP